MADDAERERLGIYYISAPKIQKVLPPLVLDDLRAQLAAAAAGTNRRKLGKQYKRLSRIRVLDPAGRSGNVLVIAYIRPRQIEDEIMRQRGDRADAVLRNRDQELRSRDRPPVAADRGAPMRRVLD